MIVFVVSGFWHGANWTYLIWGFIHGIGLAAERLLGLQRTAKNPLIRIFRILLTFHLVVFAWIYFRAKSVHQANLIISKIANEAPAGLIALGSGKMLLTDFASTFGLTLTDLRTAFGGLAFLLGAEFLWESGILARYRAMNSWSSATGRLIFFYTLALLTAAQVAPRAQSFIYFQF
jgi:D-alanyl-lipoteichoic acid acyltransferase DltB (MBOAT superfamily)